MLFSLLRRTVLDHRLYYDKPHDGQNGEVNDAILGHDEAVGEGARAESSDDKRSQNAGQRRRTNSMPKLDEFTLGFLRVTKITRFDGIEKCKDGESESDEAVSIGDVDEVADGRGYDRRMRNDHLDAGNERGNGEDATEHREGRVLDEDSRVAVQSHHDKGVDEANDEPGDDQGEVKLGPNPLANGTHSF